MELSDEELDSGKEDTDDHDRAGPALDPDFWNAICPGDCLPVRCPFHHSLARELLRNFDPTYPCPTWLRSETQIPSLLQKIELTRADPDAVEQDHNKELGDDMVDPDEVEE